MFIHEHPKWPHFTWNEEKVQSLLIAVSHKQGRLIGRMEGLGFNLQSEAALETMTLEIIKSNEIEGELLNNNEVRSSIARRLGIEIAGLVPSDRNVDGVVDVMIDATQHFQEPLSDTRLYRWHNSLFPNGYSGDRKIVVGQWRNNAKNDPMQVVSGPIGREKIHFRAPDSVLLKTEMKKFLKWLNQSEDNNLILKAGLAHLWFVTMHPFDDGNGRLARTITEMLLARADGIAKRFYSMSSQIRLERKQYYDTLEKTQKGDLEITAWLVWFINCLDRAIISSEENLKRTLFKAKYWDRCKDYSLNDRQRKVINKILDGFEGKLSSSKWAKINKCSQDTALRDIQDLISKGLMEKQPGGSRNTNYDLAKLN